MTYLKLEKCKINNGDEFITVENSVGNVGKIKKLLTGEEIQRITELQQSSFKGKMNASNNNSDIDVDLAKIEASNLQIFKLLLFDVDGVQGEEAYKKAQSITGTFYPTLKKVTSAIVLEYTNFLDQEEKVELINEV